MEELLPTLKKAAAALERHRVPYLLGGSLACWARGGPAVAADLDFMVMQEDAERALAALVESGMREERPPEQWLLKAWDGDHMVDIIFEAAGLPITDEVFAHADRLSVEAMSIPVMALEDVMTTKLRAMNERSLDYEHPVQIARSLPSMRTISATSSSPSTLSTVVLALSRADSLTIRKCVLACEATCGRCVMHMSWRCKPSARSFSPTARAVLPPMPASISSKTTVPAPPAAPRPVSASMIRDSSPPDAASRSA